MVSSGRTALNIFERKCKCMYHCNLIIVHYLNIYKKYFPVLEDLGMNSHSAAILECSFDESCGTKIETIQFAFQKLKTCFGRKIICYLEQNPLKPI